MKVCARMIVAAAVIIMMGNGIILGEGDRDKGRLTSLFGKVKLIKVVVEQSFEQASSVKLPVEENIRRILEVSGFRVVNASVEEFDALVRVNLSGEARMERYSGGPQYSGARIQGRIALEKGEAVWWEDYIVGDIPPPEMIVRPLRRPEDAPFAKALNISGYQLALYSMTYALGVDRSLSNMINGLKDRQPEIRCKAMEELERFFIPDTLPLVRNLLTDSEPGVRARALKYLGVFKDKKAFESFVAMLKDKDVAVRRQAAWSLGETGDPRAVSSLIEVMKSDIFIQATVADALVKIGEPAVDPLVDLLQRDDVDELTREAAIDTLGELRNPKAIQVLIKALATPDGWGRRKAIDALFKIGSHATNQLIDALKDPEPQIREGAIEALGRLKSSLSLEPLIAGLGDPVPAVRSRAAWALGELGDDRAWKPLNDLAAGDPDPSVRDAAAKALDQIGLVKPGQAGLG